MASKAKVVFGITTDAKRIELMVKSIGQLGAKLKDHIQDCAISCVLHAVEVGDLGYAQRLFDAMGEGFRRTSVKVWFTTHGPFGYVGKTKDKAAHFTFDRERCDLLKQRIEKNRDSFVSKLTEAKWYDAAGPERVDGFDLVKELGRLLSRAKRAQENDKVAHHKDTRIDPALLRKLTELSTREGASLH